MGGRRAQFVIAVMWLGGMLVTGSAWAQDPLTLSTTSLPSVSVGSNVNTVIGATGGAQPYTWHLDGGKLPPGLKLDIHSGALVGIPTAAGTYHFVMAVTDSGIPANRIQHDFTFVVTAALSIDWKEQPAVHGQKLEGSVVVSNHTSHDFTLTVIVTAVNQIGRATALGYQKFTLKAGAEQTIPFGSSPGPSSYVVHADAVAEVLDTNSIYRARKQTADHLVIRTI